MSVNKWIGIGNLTKDPELRYTPQGTAVCNFSIACNERFKDKSGQQQEKVEYVNIVAWKQLAETCGKYLHKGKQVYIEGSLQTRKWQDRDGNDRYTTEIVANQMQMLGRADENGGGQQGGGYQQPQPQQSADQYRQPRAGYQNDPNHRENNNGPMYDEPDKDIPF